VNILLYVHVYILWILCCTWFFLFCEYFAICASWYFVNILLYVLLDHFSFRKSNLKKQNFKFLVGIILNYFLIILITDVPYIFLYVQSNISAIVTVFKRDVIAKSDHLLSYILVHKHSSPQKTDIRKFLFLPHSINPLHMHTWRTTC